MNAKQPHLIETTHTAANAQLKSLTALTLSSLARGSLALIFTSWALLSTAALAGPVNWGLESTTEISSAWKTTRGNKNVVVAVVDTGIDSTHPDFKNTLWKAPAQPATFGWDFSTNSANPTDKNGHGTHIAGIIHQVAPDVQIMPIRYYNEQAAGSVNLANTIKALHYAINNGAKIINYSGGGPEYSEEEFQAIKLAEQKGILIVAAAGNDRRNTDTVENYYYPAAYKLKGLKNILTVASINEAQELLKSSNYGEKSVDIAAPGEGIPSAIPGGRYGKMTGTSQATAFVSGVAALLLSKNSNLTPTQIKNIILSTATPTKKLYKKVATGGIVNAKRALTSLTQFQSERKTASK